METWYLIRVSSTSASPDYNHTTSAIWLTVAENGGSSVGKTTSSAPLPDLTPNMSLSAICQLPAAALKQYAQLYQLSSDGNKQTLAQRLHAHLNTDESPSDEPGKSDDQNGSGSQDERSHKDDGTSQLSSSSSSPEGEHTPSRQRRNPRSLDKHHSRRNRCTKIHRCAAERSQTISPPSHHSTMVRRHAKQHKQGTYHQSRRRSPSSSSSSSQGRSRSRSSSSTTGSSTPTSPSPIRQRHTHHRCPGRSHSHHRRSTYKHHSHQGRRESTTVPLPHKVQHAIERSEFVDFSDLLCEHLTRAGKSAKTKKSHSNQAHR